MGRRRKWRSPIDDAPAVIHEYLAPTPEWEDRWEKNKYGSGLLPWSGCTWTQLLTSGFLPDPFAERVRNLIALHVVDLDSTLPKREIVQYGIDCLVNGGQMNAALMLSNSNRLFMSDRLGPVPFSERPAEYQEWILTRTPDFVREWSEVINFERPTCIVAPLVYGGPALIGVVARCLRRNGHESLADSWRKIALQTRNPHERIAIAQRYVVLNVEEMA